MHIHTYKRTEFTHTCTHPGEAGDESVDAFRFCSRDAHQSISRAGFGGFMSPEQSLDCFASLEHEEEAA